MPDHAVYTISELMDLRDHQVPNVVSLLIANPEIGTLTPFETA